MVSTAFFHGGTYINLDVLLALRKTLKPDSAKRIKQSLFQKMGNWNYL